MVLSSQLRTDDLEFRVESSGQGMPIWFEVDSLTPQPEGQVVVYDTVVSVPTERVYLVGPHKPLWVVQEMPALQAN